MYVFISFGKRKSYKLLYIIQSFSRLGMEEKARGGKFSTQISNYFLALSAAIQRY